MFCYLYLKSTRTYKYCPTSEKTGLLKNNLGFNQAVISTSHNWSAPQLIFIIAM